MLVNSCLFTISGHLVTMHPVFTLVLALVLTSFCGVSPALNSLVINLIVFLFFLFIFSSFFYQKVVVWNSKTVSWKTLINLCKAVGSCRSWVMILWWVTPSTLQRYPTGHVSVLSRLRRCFGLFSPRDFKLPPGVFQTFCLPDWQTGQVWSFLKKIFFLFF